CHEMLGPVPPSPLLSCYFLFHDPATTEIYTLSLHDALPILQESAASGKPRSIAMCANAADVYPELVRRGITPDLVTEQTAAHDPDRKSTRLNSSHDQISYAVFCLKKKNNPQ